MTDLIRDFLSDPTLREVLKLVALCALTVIFMLTALLATTVRSARARAQQALAVPPGPAGRRPRLRRAAAVVTCPDDKATPRRASSARA